MAQMQVYEGTLEEIVARHGSQLAGRQLKVIVEPDEKAKPFYEMASAEEWAQALREWAASHSTHHPPLSDEAISRDSIYEGRE
jgi:hypothetical protein